MRICLNFFQQADSNRQILTEINEFDLNKYNSYSPKGCVLEVDLQYPRVLRKINNDYPLIPDKIEIKREILSEYQVKTTDLYNIPIGNVKTLVPNFFDKERYVLHYESLQLNLRLGLKLKKYIAYQNSINHNG